MLRILLVGEFMWPWYQEACATALEKCGCEVVRFGWFNDFRYWMDGHTEPSFHSFWHRAQYRFKVGPTVWRVNRRLLRVSKTTRIDVVWFYNVDLIAPGVLKEMKKVLPGTTFVQYANDNPFSNAAKPGLWRHYLNSIPLFNVHFSFRLSNIEDYRRYGATLVHLLRAYFIPEEDYPVPLRIIPQRFKCDVVFAGHYEDDDRVELLEAICEAGYHLNLFGGGWDSGRTKLRALSPLLAYYPIRPVTNADYRYAICGAKIALCFLSTLNHDSYTRRSFQIPAMKVAMLSQYTDDLAILFEEDKEIVFFRDKAELIDKVKRLLADELWRKSVAEAGFEKVYSAGHDVMSRMRIWVEQVTENQIGMIKQ